MDYDPIASLESVGYLEREASFLYLVALHSGYFLRRQYCQFVQRGPGGVGTKFIEKAVYMRYLRVIEGNRNGHLYHLSLKSPYEALLGRDSPNRRIYGNASIKSRLMVLDFVLANLDAHLLAEETGKVEFFRTQCGVPTELLPRNDFTRRACFPDRFPILVSNTGIPRFCFVDEGQLTPARFQRYLQQYKPLFEALGEFELIYIADTESSVARAKALFHRLLTPDSLLGVTPSTPLGVEHFLEFLAASRRYDEQGSLSSARDLELLREGRQLYTELEHLALQAAWKMQSTNADRIRQRFVQNSMRAAFTSVVLPYGYPLFRWKPNPSSRVPHRTSVSAK